MGGTGGHSEPIVARFLIALLAVTCALLAATAPVLAGTPVDSKLDLPFPPDGQYMFRSFDESGGRVVFALPRKLVVTVPDLHLDRGKSPRGPHDRRPGRSGGRWGRRRVGRRRPDQGSRPLHGQALRPG